MTPAADPATLAGAGQRSTHPRRVLLLGATGTIGRATARALLARGHEVVAFGRAARPGPETPTPGLEWRMGDVTDPAAVAREGFRGERFDALVSCLASRTGTPQEAWAIDHLAHRHALRAAQAAGVTQVLLLSAICVQRPRLAFQHAKLAFERELQDSGLDWTIVRPTAFFKSLSGQVARVQAGRPFLVFGDGRLTSCKPIADEDLADYLADSLDDPAQRRRILPVGGPGPAITPLDQAERLFQMLGRPPQVRHVPVALIETIATGLGVAARLVPALREKAELARIGHYYATESMLVLDPETGRYDADATPSFGSRTLWDHYAALLSGQARAGLAEHAVFDRRRAR